MIVEVSSLDYVTICRGENFEEGISYCRVDEGNFNNGNCCLHCGCGCTFTIDNIYDEGWFLHQFDSLFFVDSNNYYEDFENYFYVCDEYNE